MTDGVPESGTPYDPDNIRSYQETIEYIKDLPGLSWKDVYNKLAGYVDQGLVQISPAHRIEVREVYETGLRGKPVRSIEFILHTASGGGVLLLSRNSKQNLSSEAGIHNTDVVPSQAVQFPWRDKGYPQGGEIALINARLRDFYIGAAPTSHRFSRPNMIRYTDEGDLFSDGSEEVFSPAPQPGKTFQILHTETTLPRNLP